MEKSMRRTCKNREWRDCIQTQYIVAKDWNWKKVESLENMVWATRNAEYNASSINIEIIWNFTEGYPTIRQYSSVNKLIKWIKEKYPKIKVIKHNDVLNSPTKCPWKNFDMKFIEREVLTFSLSRYYSPEEWQSKYYPWTKFEIQDNKCVKVWSGVWDDFVSNKCMNCWRHSDCTKTANWTKLNNNMMAKTVACPKSFNLGAKMYISWIGEVVCNDRGWAIKMKWDVVRIDMRCGLWELALDNRKSCPTWDRIWYVISN